MKRLVLSASLFAMVLTSATAASSSTSDKPAANAVPSAKRQPTPSATGREDERRALKGPPGWQEDMEQWRKQKRPCLSATGYCPESKEDRAEGASAKPVVQPAPAGNGGKPE